MRKYSSDKDWNVEIRKLVKLGWVYKRGGKHARLISPDDSQRLVIPTSPSDRRSLHNFRRLLR